jgi:hypothetical protein
MTGAPLLQWPALTIWKQYIAEAYTQEFNKPFIQQKQAEIVDIVQKNILDIQIEDITFETIHSKPLIGILLSGIPQKYTAQESQSILKKFIQKIERALANPTLKQNLEQLYAIRQLNKPIQDILVHILALLCANFDAGMYWAYTERNELSLRSIHNAFATIIIPIKDQLETYWKNYYTYIPEDIQKKYTPARELFVGDLASAMREPDYLDYRYRVSKPVTILTGAVTQLEPVTITINNIQLTVLIDGKHAKDYTTIINQWMDALEGKTRAIPTEIPGTLEKAFKGAQLPGIAGFKPSAPLRTESQKQPVKQKSVPEISETETLPKKIPTLPTKTGVEE